MSDLAQQCDVVFSICPPVAAVQVARDFSSYRGIYVDANAVSPATATAIEEIIRGGGGTYVDGGIIGPPPTTPGTTRLYLSGTRAGEVQAMFADEPLEAIVLDDRVASASALKMTFAAWSKISTALLLATVHAAAALDVQDALTTEWAASQPALASRLQAAERSARTKGWRWTGEMQEIAATFAAVGAPAEFGLAAAGVYEGYPRPLPADAVEAVS